MDWTIIHPEITAITKKRFDDGHLADAVESALKEVNKRIKDHVKSKTGVELDGAPLMHRALSLKKPVIVLGDLTTVTGRDIQQGYMEIFAGAMMGIRNPKAHENVTIDETRAVHFIFLASLLMYKLDEAKVPLLKTTATAALPPKGEPRPPAENRTKTSKDGLRDRILCMIADHEETGTAVFLSDKIIATGLGLEVAEIQKQLDILEHREHVTLAKAMGPSYSARLTPAGWLEVEALKDKAKQVNAG